MRPEYAIPLTFSDSSLEFAQISPYKSSWRSSLYERAMREFLFGPLGEGSKKAAENVQSWWQKLEPQVSDYLELVENTGLKNFLPPAETRSLDLGGITLPYVLYPSFGFGYPPEKPFTIPSPEERWFNGEKMTEATQESYSNWYYEEYAKWLEEEDKRCRWPVMMDVSLHLGPPKAPTPASYPLHRADFTFEVQDRLVLSRVKIIHCARKKNQWLTESNFYLWHGYLTKVRQVVKDGTFFPNPKRGRLWKKLEGLEERFEQEVPKRITEIREAFPHLSEKEAHRRVLDDLKWRNPHMIGALEKTADDLSKLRSAVKRIKQGFVFSFEPTGSVGQKKGFASRTGFIYSNGRMVRDPNTLRNLDMEETIQALENVSLFKPAVSLML